ncbi:MAG: hypothetical protein V4673_06440 [Pseudomonadota bacterium]
MKQRNSTSAIAVQPSLTVHDAEAADYLSNPFKAVFIYPFIGRARSASEVAAEHGVKLNAMAYRIERLQQLGLLRAAGSQRQRGRAVKLYRATANAFFVPLASTSLENLESMIDQWSQSLQPMYLHALARTLSDRNRQWGVRISREADDRLLIAPATGEEAFYNYFEPDAPAIIEGWFSDLRLDDEDAKALQSELLMLYLKYFGREGKRRYLLRVGMTPMPDDTVLPDRW